jgi:hypothetical protein
MQFEPNHHSIDSGWVVILVFTGHWLYKLVSGYPKTRTKNTLLASNGFSRFALALVDSVLCPNNWATTKTPKT